MNRSSGIRHITLRDWILAALFAALTAVGARISFPLGATNFTLQLFFVLLAGILLGPLTGTLSQLIYLLLGLTGVPVFTGGGGIGYIYQPSFGFVLGFVAMAWTAGFLTNRLKRLPSFWAIVIASLAAWAALYAIGLPYMRWALALGADPKVLTAAQVIRVGMLIYLPGDLIKIALAVPLGARLLPLIRQYHHQA